VPVIYMTANDNRGCATGQNATKPDWAIRTNGVFKTGAHAGSVDLDAFLGVNAQLN
jgi:hypothetical protein